uniref:Uncharacterized protein n=1 Tax=Paramoeba aestuarina TaxID=180227 RepID=A0A7S4NKL4_9EUKA
MGIEKKWVSWWVSNHFSFHKDCAFCHPQKLDSLTTIKFSCSQILELLIISKKIKKKLATFRQEVLSLHPSFYPSPTSSSSSSPSPHFLYRSSYSFSSPVLSFPLACPSNRKRKRGRESEGESKEERESERESEEERKSEREGKEQGERESARKSEEESDAEMEEWGESEEENERDGESEESEERVKRE